MNLFILGLGYSARALARRALAAGHLVGGTVRSDEKAESLRAAGIETLVFDADRDDLAAVAAGLRKSDALLMSMPPGPGADLLPRRLAGALARHGERLRWVGYLSTVGVYGDHGGGWVDETTPCAPLTPRAKVRLAAEAAWTRLGLLAGRPVSVFRLPGIYGPGRNALAALRNGSARRIVKAGQVFNRVHVEDIAAALLASTGRESHDAIYNLTDDEPSPPQDVVAYAARLLRIGPPPEIAFEEAGLSPMAASFYGENKRVRNALIKKALDFTPAFPTYREGLKALLDLGEGAA